MRFRPSSRRAGQFPVLVLLILLAASCSSWKAQVKPVKDVLGEKRWSAVRVKCGEGKPVVLSDPRIEGDSLFGIVRGYAPSTWPGEWHAQSTTPTSIPLDSIQRLEVRKFSVGKTGLNTLAFSGLLLAFLAACWAIAGGPGPGPVM